MLRRIAEPFPQDVSRHQPPTLGTAFDTFGLTAVEELFRDYLLPLLSDEECDRIVGVATGRQLLTRWGIKPAE